MIPILFNGPPGSGKDTVGYALSRILQCPLLAFKDGLFEATAEYYGVSEIKLRAWNCSTKSKHQPRKELRGHSTREALIAVSERIYKPKYGDDYFGKVLLGEITHQSYVLNESFCVVTDSGFVGEFKALHRAFPTIILFELSREGTSFAGDSRSYIGSSVADLPHVRVFSLPNHDDISDTVMRALDCVNTVTNILGENDESITD